MIILATCKYPEHAIQPQVWHWVKKWMGGRSAGGGSRTDQGRILPHTFRPAVAESRCPPRHSKGQAAQPDNQIKLDL
jgi:hypothetical protein